METRPMDIHSPIQVRGSVRCLDPSLKGAATSILLLFLMNRDLAFTEDDVGFHTGYSKPTTRQGLQSLARYGLVQCLGLRNTWYLTAQVCQLDFGGLGFLGVTDGVQTQDVSRLAEPDGARGGHPFGAAPGAENTADGVQGDVSRAEKKNISSNPLSSSSILDPDPDQDLEDQDLTTTGAEKIFFQGGEESDLVDLLVESGVYPRQARALARDEWITAARVEAWRDRLKADPEVRKVGAVLYANLRDHVKPPEAQDSSACRYDGMARIEALDAAEPPTEAQILWQRTLDQLQLQMTRATFDTWLRGSAAIGLDGDVLTVCVQHAYAADWLRGRLHHVIEATVARVAGRPVSVLYGTECR